MSKEERERLHIRDELLSGEPEVDCFLDDMNSFYLVRVMLDLVISYLVNVLIALCNIDKINSSAITKYGSRGNLNHLSYKYL